MRAIELDEIRSDAYKVILIGGSAAWGFGASSNSTTIAGYLEEFLSEKYHLDSRYHGVQVINLAQVNQTITQDLIELVHYLPIIKPNLVVGMNGWNELIANMVSDDEIINTHGRFPLNELVDWAPMSATSQTSKDFIKATRLMLRSKSLFAKSLIKDHGVKLKRSPKEAIKLGTPILLSGINNAYKLVQSYGADYMVFLQPNIYSKKYLTKSEAQSVTLYDDIRPMLGGKKTGDFLRSNNIYNGIIKSLESDIKLSVYDLSTIFSHDKEHMHYSVVHCTDKDYKKIAKTIIDKKSNVS